MKKSVIIATLLLAGMYIVFSSNSAGPASSGNGIRNGGPGSNGSCASCHGGGAGTTTMTISLVEKVSGIAANGTYKPGIVYTVSLTGNNTALPFFGFQVTATTVAQQQAGAFTNLGLDKHISSIAGLQVVEHSTDLPKTNGAYAASFDWTAPATGSGTITFHGIINGVNNDNSTNGDKTSAPATLSLNEATGTTSINKVALVKDIKIYPNPARDFLNIYSEEMGQGNYDVLVLDINGKAVLREHKHNTGITFKEALNISSLKSGVYFLQIKGNQQQVTKVFTKQ